MKILVDTNVVLDVLLKRAPFYKDSLTIFYLSMTENISGFLAAISVNNSFFTLRKSGKNRNEVYQDMDDITAIFKIAPITDNTVSTALALRWKDFEDAIQFTCAKECNVDFLITRNKDDFQSTDMSCMTPTEFIAYLKAKEEAEKTNE